MEEEFYFDDYEEDDVSEAMERFDCTCGAWEWSNNAHRFVHIADCICGSSQPF